MNAIKGIKLPQIKASKVTQTVGKAGLAVKKYSPAIMTGTGVVGLVATSYFAYKAAPRVAEIVDDMEEARKLQERYLELKSVGTDRLTDDEVVELVEMEQEAGGRPQFNRLGYIRDLLGAVALPVATGVVSISAMLFSYRILTGRVTSLTGAVATLVAEKAERDRHMRDVLTDEEYERATSKVYEKEMEVEDEDGSTKVIKGKARRTEKSLDGAWFSDSAEFARDDHAYNVRWIEVAEQTLEARLSRRGYIMLNEVYDELGLERTKEGQILGWSVGDCFTFGTDVTNVMGASGEFYPEIYVKWPSPRMIYEDVDFTGRYGVFGN